MKTFRLISVIIALMISSFCYSQSMPVVIGDSILGTGAGFSHRDICLDGEDNLWIGYYQQGVAKYNGESFTHFTSDNSGLGSDSINDLYFYDNVLYAATKGGLYRTNTAVSDPIWQTVEGTSGKVIYAALIKNGNLYAISGSQVEDSINELMIINLATNEIQQVLFEKIINSNNYRVEIDSDSDGNIYWNSKFTYGIYKYDGSQVSKIIEPVINDLPRRINTFVIVDDKIWYTIELGSVYIYDIEEASTIPISESSCYDSRFNYSSAFIENGGGGRVLMTSRANNFAEICVIENNTPTIYKFFDISLNSGFNSVILNADNRIYFSGLGFNQLYSFHLDNYLNFMADYTDDNFKYLDRNQVKAGVKSYGTFFWDGQGNASYEVPAGSGAHSLFAASLWIGGYNTETEQLHLSAEKFNQGNSDPVSTYSYDFLTGPLTIGSGTCDTATSIDFNKIWKIDKSDILAHISNIELGTNYYVSPDLYSWPGNGPEGYSDILAPFYDVDADGIYEPYQGDYPELRGDQMLWWITNDIIAPHNSTDGIPMGVEMQYTLYSYSFENPANEIEDLINYQSFLNVKISNRSVNDYDSVFVGVWTDVDLGGATDDYIGCDVARSSFYAYNGDAFDDTYNGTLGYGDYPPIQTVTILDGPYSHPDNDSIKLSKFIYFNNAGGNPAINDPNNAQEHYNYLRGYWKDNSPLCYGGTGHVSGGGNPDVPTSYMFPGCPTTDPLGLGQGGIPQMGWSEVSEENACGDRRGVGSIGPINLDSQQSVEIDILFGHIQNPFASDEKSVFNYGPMLDSLISWYNAGTIPSNYNPELLQGVNIPNTASEIQLYPNPTNGILHVEAAKIVDVNVYSIDGKLVNSYGKTSDIDLSNLPNGIYLISIETENERCVGKVIKR